MLLEFKMKNFKSFREEMDFSMIPAPKIRGLEYSLIRKKVNKKEIKALPLATIYGPNSSGKSNLIGGMEVFRSIIINGNIKDREMRTSPNVAVDKLELIPHINSSEKEPICFYIKFLIEEMIVEISIKFEVGRFLQNSYERKIIEEELKINNNLIYNRGKELEIGNIDSIKEFLIENFTKETAEKIAQSNLDSQELFFNGIFKTLYSKKLYDKIYLWFLNKFRIIFHSDMIYCSPYVKNDNKGEQYYVDKTINKAAKEFGLTSDNIAYPVSEKDEKVQNMPISMLKVNDGKENAIVPSEDFESFGTIRFLNIFPLVVFAIKNGATLVVDEFDASIHPMAIMSIIKIFHNDEINKNGAQLIFNTHNPIFLNKSLLRRDEIKFVEKENQESVHYSLSDFGTSGKKGVRNTEDYMKNYFINKYGAIKDVDFSDIFE